MVITPPAKRNNGALFQPVLTKIIPHDLLPTLHTERLIMRPSQKEDAQGLYEYMKKPEVAASSTWEAFKNKEEVYRMFIAPQLEAKEKATSYRWTVIAKEPKRIIGQIGIVDLAPISRRYTIGWSVDSAEWGKGYGTEMARAVIEFLLRHAHANRVEAITAVDNIGSWKVMEKAGMTWEATYRDYWYLKKVMRSYHQFSILRSDILPQLSGKKVTPPAHSDEYNAPSSFTCFECKQEQQQAQGHYTPEPATSYKKHFRNTLITTKKKDGWCDQLVTADYLLRTPTIKDTALFYSLLTTAPFVYGQPRKQLLSRAAIEESLQEHEYAVPHFFKQNKPEVAHILSPYLIINKATGKAEGICELYKSMTVSRYVILHVCLLTKEALQAVQAFVHYWIHHWGINRVEMQCPTTNPEAEQLLQQMGFSYEGTLREYWIKEGVPHDVAIYSLLASDIMPPQEAVQHFYDREPFSF